MFCTVNISMASHLYLISISWKTFGCNSDQLHAFHYYFFSYLAFFLKRFSARTLKLLHWTSLYFIVCFHTLVMLFFSFCIVFFCVHRWKKAFSPICFLCMLLKSFPFIGCGSFAHSYIQKLR